MKANDNRPYLSSEQIQRAKNNGIGHRTLNRRYYELGWELEKAINTPPMNKGNQLKNEYGRKRIMKLNEYQKMTERTWKKQEFDEAIKNAAFGLSGESGEFADCIKKAFYQGHPLSGTELAFELGDILYYVSVAANELGYTLEEIATMNVQKLFKRYPDGFKVSDSINRNN